MKPISVVQLIEALLDIPDHGSVHLEIEWQGKTYHGDATAIEKSTEMQAPYIRLKAVIA